MLRSKTCAILLSLFIMCASAGLTTSSEPAPPKMPTQRSGQASAANPTEAQPTTSPATSPTPLTPLAKAPEGTPAKPPEASPAVKPVTVAVKAHPVVNGEDLEAFFDGALMVQLESKHIAGAVVAVVVGNKLVFSKGYGYADVETRRPVDPQTTMFRIASVTKLFTWTAVMQLVEEGKLDLEADVNTYLKGTGVQIPPAFDKPITLKNLLTHSAGFEDRPIGLFAHQASDRPLGELLNNDIPARVRPPGTLAAYSNHGSALAGLVVSSVAGKKWEEVVEQRLLNPLRMKNTLVRQPPTDKLPETMSKGYKWEGGRFKEEAFEYVPLAPAGGMSASAADMSHFLIAHLNDGKYGDIQILKPETARRMRERLFAHDPKVDAMCYGFWELNRNGQRIIQHGGDTLLFRSLFAMIPEQKVGLFISYNTDKSGGARDEVLFAFLDRYFPATQEPRAKATADVATLKRFEGEYSGTRHAQTTYAKLSSFIQPFIVNANADGTLSAGFGSESRRYAQIEPLIFRELDGRRKLVFHEDEGGQITQIYFADVPAVALTRESALNRPRYHQGLVAGCAALFLSALLFWPVLAFARRGSKSTRFRRSFVSGLFSVFGWLLSAAGLTFLVGLGWGLSEPERVVYGTPREIEYLLLVPQVCVGLAAIVLLGSIVAWSRGYWRFSGRVHYTLVALAGVGFAYFLFYWNLLKFGAEILLTKS
ncbi:MAG TPA: serine hydrolase [Planctomycetaceae bacterium]|jgi:CubicO group peptidase (beta-lactamase class C family)|nr:serine hydrolase [Planctomycetaceae bacterium]